MADYRQECPNSECNYSGFTGHVEGCWAVEAGRQYAAEQKALKEAREAERRAPFMDLEPEDLFETILVLNQEYFDAQRKLNAARDAVDKRGLNRQYLNFNWKRRKNFT